MSGIRYRSVKNTFSDIDDSWEEEIERLKHDIKRTERKIVLSEKSKYTERARVQKEHENSDDRRFYPLFLGRVGVASRRPSFITACGIVIRTEFVHSGGGSSSFGHSSNWDNGSIKRNLYSSPIERIAPARKLTSTPLSASVNLRNDEVVSQWVTPPVCKVKPPSEDIFHDPFLACPDSSFDCESSLISLDFGLVSPNKNWSSPPQRIERAHNREWSSPHRVIDRPNPENSPGNWISMKESCFTVTHSPTLGFAHSFEPPKPTCPPPESLPNSEPRPASQTTYVLQDSEREKSQELVQPVRKRSVLENYEPERVVSTKKRTVGSLDSADVNFRPTTDKIRRLVDFDGHIIKISVLEDYEAPPLGKLHGAEGGEKENVINSSVGPVRTTISSKLPASVMRLPAKKKKVTGKGGTSNRPKMRSIKGTNKNTEEGKDEETNADDLNKDTKQIIKDLEKILKEPEKETDKASPIAEKLKEDIFKPKKLKSQAKEEKEIPVAEKRKRNVDPKAVQEYIKNQKQKRLEQVKTEKKTKDAEREARKKKLEELRIRTLKLASQSKKKKSPQRTIKVVEQEDDVTMSLGLKQTKPKVSYNESVSKLKKKVPLQKPQLNQTSAESTVPVNEKPEGKIEECEIGQPEAEQETPELKKPEETIQIKPASDLNATLKKLAESLHLKLDEKEKQLRSRPSSIAPKSVKDPLSTIPSQETIKTVKSAPEANRQVVSVDVGTIQSLKDDIKKISENFKVLHEIIVDKADLLEKNSPKKQQERGKPTMIEPLRHTKESDWFESIVPRPHPYNVFTAFKQKMNVPASISGSSVFAEPVSNKYESDFEALSIPSDRLLSIKQVLSSVKTTSDGTSEVNYYSMKGDSGSELSSSILDSDKQTSTEMSKRKLAASQGSRNSSASITTEISSSVRTVTSNATFKRNSPKGLSSRISSDRENLILVAPDIKLISNDLQEKLNNYSKNLNVASEREELKKSEKSLKEQKSDSTITELIDNISENEKSLKSMKSTNEQNAVQRVEESHIRRSFFRPEMLHLQFQAELTLLETFQQSLAHFLEAERMKTLSEVNKIVYEKAINTEKFIQREDQAIQTRESSRSTSETESVKTEINLSEKSIRTERGSIKTKTSPRSITPSEVSEKLSTSKGTLKDECPKDESPKDDSRKDETLDLSNGISGISFQMLDRMMKDEELRSEHQLALIKLREKTLNEKIKAELTFLEMKKRALKERGGDEEQSLSAIKKKQRGILLKYQSEKEEIERLKKMHKIASEERKIMIKQQKQIQQMQLTTKDMIIKLKKREKSPKKMPLKPKALKLSDSQSDIPEEISVVSDSILSRSCSVEESTRHSDLDMSSRSNASDGESEILRKNIKTLESKVSGSIESFKSKKSLLETEKYPRKRHSAEELLSWTKRLEEKENNLKELEKQTMSAANSARNKLTKSLKKISMRDRSTSPFQFQETVKTPSDTSPTEETKKSSTISEVIESNPRTETAEKSDWVGEKVQSSASEEIGEHFSKKISTSRTEYYSESFESPSSSETPKTKPEISKNSASEIYKGITIKMSLSPRMQSPRRRYSSGSDDSLNLSHTETASEQSDLESRIAALNEQLRKRKLEAERLRREQKKAQRERLRVKEQSLIKQIQAYDAYIQKKKQELEQEYEHSTQVLMKPLIKQPIAVEKVPLKHIPMNDAEKQNLYSRLGTKNKEKDESVSEKITGRESDSEVLEQMKDTSESVTEQIREESESVNEQIECKLEEEEESKIVESLVEAETSPKESSEVGKSTSVSESLPEQEAEESQSESEEQSVSIKTTLHSPERPDAEKAEVAESETVEEESLKDDYQLDSFESDVEEKMTSEGTKGSDIGTEVSERVEKETSEGNRAPEVNKSKEAEKITDSILMEMIVESLKTFSHKKAEAERRLAEESKLTLEALSSYLAKEIITEAVDDMVRVYNRKAAEEKTVQVRRRMGEILSQSAGARNQRQPQEMMVTTCDVSPASTPPEEPEVEAAEREEFLRSLTHPKREEKGEDKTYAEGERNHQPDTFSQEWFDDDFGLSRTRREAEELRLQQLQIEQEIQQLQAQQEQVPYFYLREIPNKPPPPYTPPGKPLSEIPTSEAEIIAITSAAVRILTDEISKGKEISDVEPTWEYYGNAASEHVRCYKFFLFDLAKHIIAEVFEQQECKEEVLPWLRVPERLSKYKYRNVERTFECLNEYMQKQVLISFGLSKKVTKESLLVKWIKKKRDHVDEILVGESQEEESQWTQYDEDQVTVKNEVAMGILESLLENTANVFNAIFISKMKKKK